MLTHLVELTGHIFQSAGSLIFNCMLFYSVTRFSRTTVTFYCAMLCMQAAYTTTEILYRLPVGPMSISSLRIHS